VLVRRTTGGKWRGKAKGTGVGRRRGGKQSREGTGRDEEEGCGRRMEGGKGRVEGREEGGWKEGEGMGMGRKRTVHGALHGSLDKLRVDPEHVALPCDPLEGGGMRAVAADLKVLVPISLLSLDTADGLGK
jgi:hypothetical protein